MNDPNRPDHAAVEQSGDRELVGEHGGDDDVATPAVIVPVGAPVVTAPDGLRGYAKTGASAAATFVILLLLAVAGGKDGVTADEWLTVVLGALGAGGFTFAVPNAQLLQRVK